MQRGRGPFGLAFHECRESSPIDALLKQPGDLTPESVERVLLAQILDDVRTSRVQATDALASLTALTKAKNPPRLGRPPKEQAEPAKGSVSAAMVKFLQG